VDFVTTVAPAATVITDLGVLEPRGGELTLTAVHEGVTVDEVRPATGWDLRVADTVATTAPPTAEELGALRELVAR
jgi:acyl CoA:acetate/3-ketoacid CoA transferase beta subunit